jgi:PAS domain S-box-containing protein
MFRPQDVNLRNEDAPALALRRAEAEPVAPEARRPFAPHSPDRFKPWQTDLIALAATALTLGVRLAMNRVLEGQPALVIFTLPIIFSSYLGGLRAGLVATAASYFAASYYILPPIHSFAVTSGAERWLQFFVVLAGVAISGVNEALHRAQRRAAKAMIENRLEKERTAAALKEAGDLRAALDEHAIVAITDPQGRITFVNDKFCAISKYSREELIGQDHRIINSGFHTKEFIRSLWTTIARGGVWHGEIKNRAKDGSFYWVDTTLVPFLNEDGKPRQYVAIRADITERKRVEESLRLQANLLDQSYDAILVWELDGSIRYWNRGATALYGYAKEEAIGHISHELLRIERDDGSLEAVASILRAEGRWEGELRHTASDGRQFTVETRMTVVAENDCLLVLEANRDITERKRNEEAIRQLNTDLERRVAQRTSELEVANKELEAFSYSVSHDLRAPLRAVDGFSQAVIEDYGAQLPEEGQRYLATIRSSAQKMGTLIDDLLTFSRLSRASLKKQSVNVGQLVRDVLEDLRSEQEGREIDLTMGDLPPCAGDPALLKQVWINLLSNALKYTLKRPRACIEIGCRAENNRPVYFVRDNGTGFDMRYAGKLFGVFQRLHRAEDYEGTGVGLAIVQRIIHRHGGRIWADAAVDHGATFSFTLEERANL